MSFSPANITALVIAASFAAGLNIYATVLTLGILARTQWVALPPGLDSLGHTWVITVCAVMFGIEFIADKIPGFDLIWNALHTIVRVPIAALVATHGSKTALRAVVTPSPEPVSNIALSTTEDAVAIGLTWFATHHPVIGASIALVFLVAAAAAARALLRAIRRPLRRLFGSDVQQEQITPKRTT
jgi:hypothetical protein